MDSCLSGESVLPVSASEHDNLISEVVHVQRMQPLASSIAGGR